MADLPPNGFVPFDWTQANTSPNAAATPAAAPAPDNPAPAGFVPMDWSKTAQPAAPGTSGNPDNFNHPQSEAGKYLANALTGVQNFGPMFLGLPHMIGQLADSVGSKVSGMDNYITGEKQEPSTPSWLTRHTYSPDEISSSLFKANNSIPVIGPALSGNAKPYKPETELGQYGQDLWSIVPSIAAGGVPALVSGAGGVTAADAARNVTDDPMLLTGAGLLGSLLAHKAPGALARVAGTDAARDSAAAGNIVHGATGSAQDIVNAIDQTNTSGKWNFPGQTAQPAPTLATVTQDAGLQNLEYGDRVKAARDGNPVYRSNDLLTNQAQQEALSGAQPDLSGLPQAQSDLSTATGKLPIGVSAQDAGQQFRSGLQTVYDQRKTAQQAAGSPFDALNQSGSVIDLQPVIDKVTPLAATHAGDLGNAYMRALGQFKSASGLTLDTPQFAQSVLQSLGDLIDSYPPGSAARRAVTDVKNMTANHIEQQAPEVGQARQQYAAASRPLDVFDSDKTPGPIANAVDKTPAGTYTTPNDAVVSQFLKGNGAPDAIDNLKQVFGNNTEAATSALRDHIASEVQRLAVNADGTVDLAKLNNIKNQYRGVLSKMEFGDLNKQFSTIEGAQDAVSQLQGKQAIFDKFNDAVTLQRDQAGNPVFSAKKFTDALANNQADLVKTFGQDGAATLTKIGDQVTDMAQMQYAKATGTSGTGQTTPAGHGGQGNVLSALIMEHIGDMGEHVLGAIPGGKLAGLVGYKWLQGRNEAFAVKVQEVTRKALTDPVFARKLLVDYKTNMPSAAGKQAMNYVRGVMAGEQATNDRAGQ